MDALFVSTSLGRLTNYIGKKCFPIMLTMKPYPPGSIVIKFINSVCESIDICDKLIRSDTLKDKVPCMQAWLWAKWLGTGVVPVDQMRIIEKACLCAMETAPSSRVAKHAFAYLLKISG
ncbi:hypothetical protein V5799_026027 [Amblyomma americanum]|uniref:Uncharacterized protein n=1 Tax=Amblyomma americanum TaxID=6943 RepID=A0AAQ4DJR4_AMBAM